MSTIAGMYFMRTDGQDIPTSECSVMNSEEANLNLSEDENTSCSNSEMGCESLAASNNNNKPNNTSSHTPLSSSSSSSRKNKRKNFKPRNITEYAGSDEEEHGGGGDVGMKLRQRLSTHQPLKVKQYRHQYKRSSENTGYGDGDDEDDDDEEDDNLLDNEGKNGFTPDDMEEDTDDSEEGAEGGKEDRFSRNTPPNRVENTDDDRRHHRHHQRTQRNFSDDEEEERLERRFRPRDGPLDLSDVQENDSLRMWNKAKHESSIQSAIRNLMINLNNNIDPVADPSSYLSHQVAMAAAAAAATGGTNPSAPHVLSRLPLMRLPSTMGIDLRLSRNHLQEEDNNMNPPTSSTAGEEDSTTSLTTAATTTSNKNNSNGSNNNNQNHHHYNLRHSNSSSSSSNNNNNNAANNDSAICSNLLNNNSNNNEKNEEDERTVQSRSSTTPDMLMHGRKTSTPNQSSSSPSHYGQRRSSMTPPTRGGVDSGGSPVLHHQQQQHTPMTSHHHHALLQASLTGNGGGNEGVHGGTLNLHSLIGSSSNSMNDFAENTMKELLGLYGIAENIRQAGGKLPNSSDILNNLHQHHLESMAAASAGHDKMMLPENMASFLAAMQESVVSAAAAAAAANQNSAEGGSVIPRSVVVNGVSSNSSGDGNNASNKVGKGSSITGNENSSSGTSNENNSINNNNNASSSSASSTPNPTQMMQHLQHPRPPSSSPTLLNHQLNQPQLHQHHQPLNFANINSLVQQPLVSSGSSPNRSNIPSPLAPAKSPGPRIMGNHRGTSLFGSSAANVLLKSAKTRSSGRSPTGRGLTAFPVIREGLLGKGSGPVDYTRYVRRYGNSVECGYHHCRELNYREHFHCLDCSNGTRVFVKKEEMIRHFKWHKKRDESLQHGFMRYSPMDDCSDRFLNCQHNRKQTHYHCLKDNCEKVYISTSDVQMHANYHRKDSAIIQEGFQRFRAVEDCGNDSCTFRHQRTTHFHCRRPTCSYTFKNKADMEKHKSYHIKDEQLNKDGFKKFMKHETCNYNGCRFARVCNHIHCIREGCNYVLHSSGQLYSHKRKHERRDSELAYRRFKLTQSLMRGTLAAEISGTGISNNEGIFAANKSEDENNSRSSINDGQPPAEAAGPLDSEEIIKKFIKICQCDAAPEEHFHCVMDNCRNALLGSIDIASEHSKNHEIEERISSLAFFTVDPANFDAQDSTIPCVSSKCAFQSQEKHYHCIWEGCSEIVLATEEPFRRLDHFRTHQNAHNKMEVNDKECGNESTDGFFKRKRGRPPKNRVIEVSSGSHDTAIFTSFKLPKLVNPGSGSEGVDISEFEIKDPIGFLSFPEGASCNDPSCPFQKQINLCHYHCGHPRCHFSVTDVHKLSAHLRDFHTNVDIQEGYAYYDRNTDCRDGKCEFRNKADHFHCTRDGLTFVQYAMMMTHDAEAHDVSKSTPTSDDDDGEDSSQQWNNQVIKASGTFFPGNGSKENPGNNPMDLSSPFGTSEPAENSETQFGPELPCGRAFCKLKRKHHYHCTLCNQAFSELDKLRPHVVKHSSFSPLKQADSEHYTDEEVNKNDQEEVCNSPEQPTKSSSAMPKENIFGKHEFSPGAIPPGAFPPTSLPNFLNYPGSQSPFSQLLLQQHQFSLYANMMFGGAPPGVFQPGMMGSPPTLPQPHHIPPSPLGAAGSGGSPVGLGGLTPAEAMNSISPLLMNSSVQQHFQKVAPGGGHKRPSSPNSSSPSSPSGDGASKKPRMQMRILKDEPVPSGYVRFRFNEDCNYPHCGYREHQTHFHCTREDCGYSFCDKTRFVQHTARHERLDTLMGGDFKQYRANISCGRSNCSYIPSQGGPQGQNKASHFHCSKCDFVCTDTNKVVAHRRQHQKLDSITAAGFEKFTPSQHCNIGSCIHSQKQTHYHCLKCSYAVLGLSQMSAHKYRHADE